MKKFQTLIVSHSGVTSEDARRHLAGKETDVEVATTAREAVNIMRHKEPKPDLVIVDSSIPISDIPNHRNLVDEGLDWLSGTHDEAARPHRKPVDETTLLPHFMTLLGVAIQKEIRYFAVLKSTEFYDYTREICGFMDEAFSTEEYGADIWNTRYIVTQVSGGWRDWKAIRALIRRFPARNGRIARKSK